MITLRNYTVPIYSIPVTQSLSGQDSDATTNTTDYPPSTTSQSGICNRYLHVYIIYNRAMTKVGKLYLQALSAKTNDIV